MPSHCQVFSTSPKIIRAPVKVQSGPVALIGVTIEIGRFLSAKNENIHEPTTIIAFIKTMQCSPIPIGATYKPADESSLGINRDKIRGIEKQTEPVRAEKNKTGMTAFLFKESFLKTSYMPKNRAEKIAGRTHIDTDFGQRYQLYLKNLAFIVKQNGELCRSFCFFAKTSIINLFDIRAGYSAEPGNMIDSFVNE